VRVAYCCQDAAMSGRQDIRKWETDHKSKTWGVHTWVGILTERGRYWTDMCPVTETWFLDVQRERIKNMRSLAAGPGGRAVQDVGLRPLPCWDYGFESRRRHGRLMWVLCFVRQRSLRRADYSSSSPTEYGVAEWDREAPQVEHIRTWIERIKIYIGYGNMNEMEYYGLAWEFGNWEVSDKLQECVPYVKAKKMRYAVEM
jgi:hypothetical protein